MAAAVNEFKVGDVIHGFCFGAFGRDSYVCRRVEAVGRDWIVTRNFDGAGVPEFVSGDRLPSREEAEDRSYCDEGRCPFEPGGVR